VPVASLMIVGGVILALIFCCTSIPITAPMPLVRDESLNRQLFIASSLMFVFIGIGLLNRNRLAWYLFLACLAFGIAVPLIGFFDKPFLDSIGVEPLIFATVLNTAWGVVLYVGMRSVFNDIREP